jgi:hypothetical protein
MRGGTGNFSKLILCDFRKVSNTNNDMLYGLLLVTTFAFFMYVTLHIHGAQCSMHLHNLLVVLNTTQFYPTSACTYSFPSNEEVWVPSDKEILGTLMVSFGGIARLSQMLKGAHVVVVNDDRRDVWLMMRNVPGSYKRWSSHRSIVPQIGVPVFHGRHSILTGINRCNNTWFQFESDAWKRVDVKSVFHLLNFIYYKVIGYQVGPYGVSRNTESHPLYVSSDCRRSRHGISHSLKKK